MAVVEPNLEVRVFDELLVNKMMDIHNFRHNNHEALEPLTKLFENTPSKGCSNIAPVSGNLKLVNTKSNEKVYVLDPNKPSLIPIIYITDGNDVLYGKNIKRGSILSPNDINLSNYLDHNDFNKLIEIFITKVQKMYDSQGVDVNSKHIEMILRLMTNWVLITKSKVRDILEGEEID